MMDDDGGGKTENGKGKVEDGEWRVESGGWRVEDGRWKTEVASVSERRDAPEDGPSYWLAS